MLMLIHAHISSFSADLDHQTGFRTRNLLCVPVVVIDKHGDRVCAAVIEAANKHGEANFSDEGRQHTKTDAP